MWIEVSWRCILSDKKDQAIMLYKKGIDELEKGIAIEIQGVGECDNKLKNFEVLLKIQTVNCFE